MFVSKLRGKKWKSLFDWLEVSGEKEIIEQIEGRTGINDSLMVKGNPIYFRVFASKFAAGSGRFLYLDTRTIPELPNPLGDFLQDLIEVFEFSQENLRDLTFKQSDVPYLFHRDDVSIIGTSNSMNRLADLAANSLFKIFTAAIFFLFSMWWTKKTVAIPP